MIRTPSARRRRPASRATRLAASAAITAATAAVAGSNVHASWTSSATDSSGTYSAATVTSAFSTGGNAFSTSVSDMLPGDYSVGYTALRNTGSVPQTFTGAVSDDGGALADPGGLRISVDACSVAWADGACSGTATALVAATDVASAPAIAYGLLAAGDATYLKVRVELPADADESFQGTSAVVSVSATGATAAGSDRSAG